jgi:hypothetical protein
MLTVENIFIFLEFGATHVSYMIVLLCRAFSVGKNKSFSFKLI